MSILVDGTSRVLVQGLGSQGRFHAEGMRAYGTKLVGAVHPGRGGEFHGNLPIFDTVREARRETGVEVSVVFVPPMAAGDAICEAVEAGVRLVICITEHVPVRDVIAARAYAIARGGRLVGPNCPGVISPGGRCKIGIMPGSIHRPGRVGVISRSGTLTYEAVAQLGAEELGQSTCVGIGGDPVIGSGFRELLELFQADEETDGVVCIGEIGGNAEAGIAQFAAQGGRKPLLTFVAGRTAPPGRRMGHAGAIISGGGGTAESKYAMLEEAGVTLCRDPAAIGQTMARLLKGIA